MILYRKQLKAVLVCYGDPHFTHPERDLTEWVDEDDPNFQKRLEEFQEEYKDSFGSVEVYKRFIRYIE